MTKKTFRIAICFVLLISCADKHKTIRDNNSRNPLLETIQKYSLLCFIKGGNIDSTQADSLFPIEKTILFPDGIKMEIRRFTDSHKNISLILIDNGVNTSVIPFVGTTVYEEKYKRFWAYNHPFSVELNKAFRANKAFVMAHDSSGNYLNSPFFSNHSFVSMVMHEISRYPFVKIRNSCDVDSIRQLIAQSPHFPENPKQNQALDSVDIDIRSQSMVDYYALASMIFSFKYIDDSIAVTTVNKDLSMEFVW